MVQYGVNEELYLDVCKYYFEIYKTKSVQESDDWKNVRIPFSFIPPHIARENEWNDDGINTMVH